MYHNRDMNQISEILRAARKAKGMTQQALAKKAKVSQTTISDLERGRNSGSTELPAIASALGMTVDALLGNSHLDNATDAVHTNDQKHSTEVQHLFEKMVELEQANKLPPEVIAMLRQTLNTIEKVQDKQTEIVAGEAPAIDKRSA